ncbi:MULTISPECIES: acylneuraminate cytidylyltransferase family protein [Duncaniella]|jgi:N-acylneuraminate cytidylyltransferase|uniref:Acylneuraminate cytidylyltransferase family protein n=1 Tax=Duncaniella dubosii TaxID=2518971 RepID=A0A4V1D305_9BACT|nr:MULTISPECIES: acylneuraminate cytidylyltransferase family protein [Duncaniella]QCD41328.1 acylneuraminate cytidylyltransferase family protein [Duncaniella dubosii]ROS88752.1 acylneuraminate cytidylyltransferase family protein [Muribaculaceae bacterium Isolate-080 (Janvier)]HBN62478.1 acylneuraminate cytidylyltransferase family protein [Porphyromonadaceae bacterium]
MTYRNNTLFIIPARGGSKGIPRKNIKPLRGKPLIHYSIEVARALSPDSHIIVSTDDDEIRSVAQATGLPVDYRRPPELGGDKVGSREVIIDAMDWADKNGIAYDKVVLLQPTSPLRTVNDVEGCLKLYTPDTDMVVTVTEAACNPYYDCFECSADGLLHVSKGDGRFTRRQDAPKAWQFNGAVYVINPDSIRRMPLGQFPHRIPYEMPRSRSVDLDTPLDWLITEKIMEDAN